MKENNLNTPPSSVNGDDINEVIYVDEMEEIHFDDEMEEDVEQYEDNPDIEPPEDHATLVFDKHVGSVFCCDLHPNGKLAVSGGEDDKAYVWSTDTGNLIMDCKGHKDSVIFVGFSHDGTYLASADMSGMIKVWKCNLEGDGIQDAWQIVFEYEAEDLSWGLWHFGARVFIVGAVTGDIFVFKIPSGETKVLQGFNSKVECGKLFPDGVRLAAGYEDGSIKVWDLKSSSVLQQVPANIHQMRVTAIDTHPENNLMASISSDGKIVLTTSSNGKIVGQLEADNDLEVVAFCQDLQLPLFAIGTLNGAVSTWDIVRQMLRHHCAKSDDSQSGVTKMIWIKDHIATGCLDGSLRVYEGRSGELSAMMTGHLSEVLDLCYNAKENIILTSSDDGTARIFKCGVNKDNN